MKDNKITIEDLLEEICDFLHERLVFDEIRIPIKDGAYTIVAPTDTNERFWYWCVFKTVWMFDTMRYGYGVHVHAQASGSIHILINSRGAP